MILADRCKGKMGIRHWTGLALPSPAAPARKPSELSEAAAAAPQSLAKRRQDPGTCLDHTGKNAGLAPLRLHCRGSDAEIAGAPSEGTAKHVAERA